MILRWLAAVAVGIVANSATAFATGSLGCVAVGDSGAFIDVNVGQAAVEAPVWVRLELGEARWSTLDEDVTGGAVRVVIVQHFADATRFDLDVADENQEKIVASLRLLRVAEGDDYIEAGYLAFPGRGAYAVTCLE